MPECQEGAVVSESKSIVKPSYQTVCLKTMIAECMA